MKRTEIFLLLVAIFAGGIGYSTVDLGWPRVGFEAAAAVFAHGVIIGVACAVVAAILLVVVAVQTRRLRTNPAHVPK